MSSRNARSALFRSNKMNKSYDITTMPSNARNSNSGSSSDKQMKPRIMASKPYKRTPLQAY